MQSPAPSYVPSRTRAPGIHPAHWRAFRLCAPLPVVAEFFSVRLVIDLCYPRHTGGSECLMVHLPWQDIRAGRELDHAGYGALRHQLATRYEIECPSLAEVLFLRLARQGDAEELTGLFCKLGE